MTEVGPVRAAETPIWSPDPDEVGGTEIAAFTRMVEQRCGLELAQYHDLWSWSVEHIEDFWSSIWAFFDIRSDLAPTQVLATAGMPGATWFPGVSLSYVEHVFRDRSPDAVAVVEVKENGDDAFVSWAELESKVAAVAATLRGLGVGRGDRVVGYLPNGAAAIIAFLATASLGAIWSACGQDYAAPAAANRLAQLDPVVLVCADGYHFFGREHDRRDEAVRLSRSLPNIRAVLYVRHLGLAPQRFDVPLTEWAEAQTAADPAPLVPERVPFAHPLWVLYSSGTTGVPKGIVHGHGGVILDGYKSIALHLGLRGGERMFWYTTTNWMMWNFNVAALLVGACVVAYDGSPAHPSADRLWRLAGKYGVGLLGTSPGYLAACEKHGVSPTQHNDLSALRIVGATGSPVPSSASTWISDQFEGRVPLVATSGGTDVVAGLAIWAPTLSTWPGEISCAALGVAIDAWDEHGAPVRSRVGELVVTRPMPTMPLYLWDDPDGRKYRSSYFDVYPGVWRHGDWITITERHTIVVHGRSDATLNRHGVRLGSADVYEIVEAMPGIRDSLVVGLDQPDGGYWLPLFVVLEDGWVLDDVLRSSIADTVRREASPRHVPDEIIEVAAIPRTRTGKKLEVPIKRILLGARPTDVLSLGAVDDPAALDAFIELAAARGGAAGAARSG